MVFRVECESQKKSDTGVDSDKTSSTVEHDEVRRVSFDSSKIREHEYDGDASNTSEKISISTKSSRQTENSNFDEDEYIVGSNYTCSEDNKECKMEIPDLVEVETVKKQNTQEAATDSEALVVNAEVTVRDISNTIVSSESLNESCSDSIEEELIDTPIVTDSETSTISETELSGSEYVVDEKLGVEQEESDSDGSSEEVFDNDSDNNSNYSLTGSIDTVFIDDDGAEYILIPSASMTREYILLNEDEDEGWFLRSKVTNEVKKFVAGKHTIKGKSNCKERNFRLNKVLKQLNTGVENTKFKTAFLDEGFMWYYDFTEGY